MVRSINNSQIQTLRRNINMVDGKQKIVNLVKENNRLTSATISQIGNDGKEYTEKNFHIGNNEFAKKQTEYIINKIRVLCDKAKDGIELFADIMGWIK